MKKPGQTTRVFYFLDVALIDNLYWNAFLRLDSVVVVNSKNHHYGIKGCFTHTPKAIKGYHVIVLMACYNFFNKVYPSLIPNLYRVTMYFHGIGKRTLDRHRIP